MKINNRIPPQLNKRSRIAKGQSKNDNPEKLAQYEYKQNKNTTQYVLDTTMRKKTQIA